MAESIQLAATLALMQKIIILFTLFCLTFFKTSCNNQKSNATSFKVDSTLEKIAMHKIWNEQKPRFNCAGFSSHLTYDFFENDSLVVSQKDSVENNFWARYYWYNDTLHITGNFGQLTSLGFVADIYGETHASVFVNACSHDEKRYNVTLEDTLTKCVKAPCFVGELVISKIPDSTKDELIYGHINLKSKDYYYHLGKDITKLRTNMTFYFRACNFTLYLKRKGIVGEVKAVANNVLPKAEQTQYF